MALMQLGIITTDVRGSVKGTVFSRNLGGSYMRGRVAPVNRNTPAQTLVRQNFAANAKLWSGSMTAAQRTAWTFFAQANPLVNVLGASIIVSGLAMAQKLNQVLSQIGGMPSLDPPADMSVPVLAAVTGADAQTTGPVIEVQTNAQAVVAGAKYYVFATKPLAAGKKPAKSDYRFIGAFAAVAAATSFDFTSQYEALFGEFAIGQSIGVLVSTVNTTTGAVTPGLVFNILATA
jgi:hypothetical protein